MTPYSLPPHSESTDTIETTADVPAFLACEWSPCDGIPTSAPYYHEADEGTWARRLNSALERPYRDERVLRRLYIDDELSIETIADVLGCAYETVRRWLARHDIPTRARGTPRQVRCDRSDDTCGYIWYQIGTQATGGPGLEHVSEHKLAALAAGYDPSDFERIANRDPNEKMQCHHQNRQPVDNRPVNIEPLPCDEHQRMHRRGQDIAHVYRHRHEIDAGQEVDDRGRAIIPVDDTGRALACPLSAPGKTRRQRVRDRRADRLPVETLEFEPVCPRVCRAGRRRLVPAASPLSSRSLMSGTSLMFLSSEPRTRSL